MRKILNLYTKKGNYYEVSIGNTGEYFYISKVDYNLVKIYTWCISSHGYIIASLSNNKQIYLHRYIMNFPNCGIDHKNRNKKDNRNENLRICSQSTNSQNMGISKANKSGHKGIFWDKNRNKWMAYITINWKRIGLGRFKNIEDAIQIRKEYENKYFSQVI